LQTNYGGHDAQYLRRRAAGFVGWETAAGADENIAHFAEALSGPHVPHNGRLLEMGCGAGDLTLWFAAQGYTVYGVDIAPAAIIWAQEKAEALGLNAEFSVGDVRCLSEFEDETFDIVIDGRCLHCIIGEDRALFLASARRVLRPGGIIHINTMCNEPKSVGLRVGFDPMTRCQIVGDFALRYCGFPADIVAEVISSGFEILSWRVVDATRGGEDLLLIDAVKPEKRSSI
jgi:SAM-dependent methyltransferase